MLVVIYSIVSLRYFLSSDIYLLYSTYYTIYYIFLIRNALKILFLSILFSTKVTNNKIQKQQPTTNDIIIRIYSILYTWLLYYIHMYTLVPLFRKPCCPLSSPPFSWVSATLLNSKRYKSNDKNKYQLNSIWNVFVFVSWQTPVLTNTIKQPNKNNQKIFGFVFSVSK